MASVWQQCGPHCKADWFLRPSERWKKLMPGKQLHQGPGQSCVEQWSLHFHCTCCHAQEAHITFTQDNPVLSSGGHCTFIALDVRPRRYRSPPPRAPRSRSPPREPRTILCWSLHFHGTCCHAQEGFITFTQGAQDNPVLSSGLCSVIALPLAVMPRRRTPSPSPGHWPWRAWPPSS